MIGISFDSLLDIEQCNFAHGLVSLVIDFIIISDSGIRFIVKRATIDLINSLSVVVNLPTFLS